MRMTEKGSRAFEVPRIEMCAVVWWTCVVLSLNWRHPDGRSGLVGRDSWLCFAATPFPLITYMHRCFFVPIHCFLQSGHPPPTRGAEPLLQSGTRDMPSELRPAPDADIGPVPHGIPERRRQYDRE